MGEIKLCGAERFLLLVYYGKRQRKNKKSEQSDKRLVNTLLSDLKLKNKNHQGDRRFGYNHSIRDLREKQNILHRDILIKHILGFEWTILAMLSITILLYIIFRFCHPDKSPLISDETFKYFIIGIFAEITGLVYIVTRYLWWRPQRKK